MDFSTLDPSILLTSEGIISLLTLTALEIVLGIDNIIVISILSGELKGKERQRKAQRLGLALAMITRLALLFSISFNLFWGWFVILSAVPVPNVLNYQIPALWG